MSKDGNVDTGSFGFYTSNGSNPTERMRITSAGNVGIGQTNPQSLLHVGNGSGVILSAGANTWADNAVLSNGWTSGPGDWLKIEVPSGDNESGFIQLNSNGKVGIGTTNPDAKLEVLGTGSDEVLRIVRGNIQSQYLSFRGYQMASNGNHMLISADDTKQVWLGHQSTTAELVVDVGGNVGIGTTSPSAKLDVNGAGNFQAVQLYLA